MLCYGEHATSRRVVAEQLENNGAVVKTASTWNEARKALVGDARRKQPYNLLLIDVAEGSSAPGRLPDVLQDETLTAGIPLVLLTPAGKANILPGDGGPRADRTLTKPPAQSELIETLLDLAVRAKESAQDQTAEPANGGNAGLHILLAEDGAVNQEVAAGLLEMSGHTVEIANNGREAVEVFQRGAFNVVLMDLEMPEMDGLEATRRIREYESVAGGHTPIVAMTAHAVQGFRERCLAGGMDNYITKPIDLSELLRVLALVTENRPLSLAATT